MTNHLPTVTALAVAALLLIGIGTAFARPATPRVDPAVGQALPAIDLPDLKSSERVSINENGGRVVLLDFWATWCKPCMKSLPVYESWQKELGARGFAVLAVSVDEADAPVARFAARLAPSVQVLLDPEGLAPSALALGGLPVAFLVGRDGIVRSHHVGFHTADEAALKAEIEALLDEAAPSTEPPDLAPDAVPGDGPEAAPGAAPEAAGDVAPEAPPEAAAAAP